MSLKKVKIIRCDSCREYWLGNSEKQSNVSILEDSKDSGWWHGRVKNITVDYCQFCRKIEVNK